jgi:taurine transport system permease protein
MVCRHERVQRQPLFLPKPQNVWKAFVTISVSQYKGSTLWQHLAASLQRLVTAFGLAVVTAVPLGLASGYVPWIKAIWEPIIEFYRPLPPLAYYTLLVLWMGIDNESKIMLLYLACFAPIYVACASAVMRIGQNYIRNAEVLGAKKGQVFLHVILPFTLPEIFVGMRMALGWATPPSSRRKWSRRAAVSAGWCWTRATTCAATSSSWASS